MKQLLNWLYEKATIRNLVLAVMVIIPLNAFAFPMMSAHFRELSGGISTLDVKFAYTPDQARQIIENYSPQARAYYLTIEWTADLLYPITYATLFAFLLAVIYRAGVPGDHFLRRFALLPYLMMTADYTENITISLLLATYPKFLPGILAALASVASFMKWLLGGSILIALITGLFMLGKHLATHEPTNKEIDNEQ